MRFKKNFLLRYLEIAPAALALERSIECEMHSCYEWQKPILDIGCGDGIFATILCCDKIETGIDPDESEIEHARDCRSYEELIVCFGDRIPKPDKSYATIVSNSVLEHIPELLPVLKEAHRLLKDDGRFYITIPSNLLEQATLISRLLSAIGLRDLARRYGLFYNWFWRHYHAYDDAGWRELFSQANLEVVEFRPYIPKNISTFYDLLTALALPSLVSKKFFRRWILWPTARRKYASVLYDALTWFTRCLGGANKGCLLFYSLRTRQS